MTDTDDDRSCGCEHGDEIKIGPELPDGSHVAIRHFADHEIRPCMLRPMREGKPIMGDEIVSLSHVEGDRYGVTPLLRRKGPSTASTESYRSGWDRIFDQTN